MDIQTFNEGSLCPKCGHIIISTEYRPEDGYLRRKCQRCLYWWSEKTLDYEEAPDDGK